MGIALRQARFDELPLLGNIRRQAIMAQPETYWNLGEKQKAVDAWETMDVQNNFALYKLYIAEDNSAFMGWKGNYLGYLFLLPKTQKQGLGSQLLKMAEEEISKENNHIWLFAHPYSEEFYKVRGYEKRPETEDAFGTGPLYKFQKNF